MCHALGTDPASILQGAILQGGVFSHTFLDTCWRNYSIRFC